MTQLELVDGVLRGEAFLASLENARVTVIGLARQTTTAARLLHGAGAHVRVEPVFTTADLSSEQLIVVTAAAALDSPAVAAARAAGVVVLGELDLGWCATEADALAITGGVAAAAAVRFAHAVLGRQGRPVLAAGGTEPELLACAPGFRADGLVLIDPSPAQLATAQVFRPRVAVLMGLGGHDALLAHQTPRDCLVLDADDADARALARQARARVLWCSASGALDHGVYIARGRIAARLNGHVEEICPVSGLPRAVLPAALAAVACALWAGMAPDAIGEALAPGRPIELAGSRAAPDDSARAPGLRHARAVADDSAAGVAPPVDLWRRAVGTR
jgi:UDP-N-acetylmuramoylalanine-D-glutamate ligase